MFCSNCGSQIIEGSKFCPKCGQSISSLPKSATPTVQTLTPEKIDITKIQNNLKNTGNSVYAIGWLNIILNVGIYLWSISDKNFSQSGLPHSGLSGTFVMVVVSSIFIILGKRIKEHKDKNIKLYLQILIGLSIALLVWVVSTGGTVGLLFFLVLAYLVSSLTKIGKAMKSEDFMATLSSPVYRLGTMGWSILAIAAFILFFVALGFDMNKQTTISTQSNTQSKAELIQSAVQQIKTSMTLPNKLDQVTTLTDVTAEPGAIRYHYTLSGADTSNFSNDYVRSFLKPKVCGNSDTKSLLNEDINMEYSYVVEGTAQNYFTSFTKTDCIQ
ncbi:zinc ribbon domain-containing protein [Pedobacter sp.]|jgi:hypothetical protein|uniref:zinc ribbon domain-containing protein n=1 Tax=Pedobacter sp. TaxID=1411316 RepID=UPI002B99ED75|nr:zinc-ribbon domain-containing protein [Pedobacter sp.]HWW41888.1 zinc-ribbon domain-containing protein [Pedobacter sp.]